MTPAPRSASFYNAEVEIAESGDLSIIPTQSIKGLFRGCTGINIGLHDASARRRGHFHLRQQLNSTSYLTRTPDLKCFMLQYYAAVSVASVSCEFETGRKEDLPTNFCRVKERPEP